MLIYSLSSLFPPRPTVFMKRKQYNVAIETTSKLKDNGGNQSWARTETITGCCVLLLRTEIRTRRGRKRWRDQTCDDGGEVAGVDAGGDLLGGGRGAEARRATPPPGPAPEPHRWRHYFPRMPAEIRHHLLKHGACPSPEACLPALFATWTGHL